MPKVWKAFSAAAFQVKRSIPFPQGTSNKQTNNQLNIQQYEKTSITQKSPRFAAHHSSQPKQSRTAYEKVCTSTTGLVAHATIQNNIKLLGLTQNNHYFFAI